MARRHAAIKRTIVPDPVYHSTLVTKFINCLMVDGKKSIAEKILYEALEIVDEKSIKAGTGESGQRRGYLLLKKAIENVSPLVEVRSRRVGGATYQIPVEVAPARQLALAMRWLIESARKRKEKGMIVRLANELSDALAKKGGAYDTMERVIKMARANQAFAHYRW